MKILFSTLTQTLAALFLVAVSYSPITMAAPSGTPLTPIPASLDAPNLLNCQKITYRERLNAVDGVIGVENSEVLQVAFRVFMVDCGTKPDGKYYQKIYGPLHEDRCDHTVDPFNGVALYSVTAPLGAYPPYEKTPVCGVWITFDKAELQKNPGVHHKYIYRYNAFTAYYWDIYVNHNPVSKRYEFTVTQLPH